MKKVPFLSRASPYKPIYTVFFGRTLEMFPILVIVPAMSLALDLAEVWADVTNATSSEGSEITCHFGVVCIDINDADARCEAFACAQGDPQLRRSDKAAAMADKSKQSKQNGAKSEGFGNRIRCHCGVVCQWGFHQRGARKICNGPLYCSSCYPSSPAYGSVGIR